MSASMNQAAMNADTAAGRDETFHVIRPHWGWWASIVGGMTLVTVLAANDRAYALFSEYVTSWLPRPLLAGIAIAAWLTHVGEASYAYKLATEQKLYASRSAWTLQTFILGYPSLKFLLRRRDGR